VADDDLAILDCIQLILEDEGYKVKTTANGAEVPALVKTNPNLLLLDVWMSGQDGREICKKIKGNKLTKNLPIILISANKDTKQIAKESGANDFIEKPFEIEDLVSKVKKYVSAG
jgi:CheY-like chemotaxis protein